MRHRALALGLVLAFVVATAQAGGLAVRAERAHLGDGRTLEPAVVLIDGGTVVGLGTPAQVRVPAGWPTLRCVELLPGLVASSSHADVGGVRSIAVDRLAADRVDPFVDRPEWLAAAVTAVDVSPGADRLIPGRGAVLRLTEAPGQRLHVREGPLHAVLGPRTLHPPRVFEATVPVNVDAPLQPAREQRPGSPAAAIAELRRLLEEARLGLVESEGGAAFREIVAGKAPLRVHAHRREDIAAALSLASEHELELVIAGATEAWALVPDIAASGALVVLTDVGVDLAPSDPSRGQSRPDTARRLVEAGVRVALASPPPAVSGDLAPLVAAGAAVRRGLSPERAIAAVTGHAAEAAGARDLGRLEVGAPADLAGFDTSPLALRAQPRFVLVGGRVRHEAIAEAEPVLVVRAGTLKTTEVEMRDVSLVLREGLVASRGSGSAVPAGSRELEFGPGSVVVPGFVDAWSHVGLEPGARPPGSVHVDGADAIELDHPSLPRAIASGVTAALIAPATSGNLRGRPDLVATVALPADDEAGRPRPEVERLRPAAGLAFHLDGGPRDTGAREGRLRALQGLLRKAKGYHDKWEASQKQEKGEKKGEKKAGKGKRGEPGPPPVLQDARNRPGRRDRGSGAAPPARRASKPAAKKPPERDPELEPFRALFRGQAKAFLRAGRHDSIAEGLEAFAAVGLKPVLVGGEEANLLAAELAKAGVGVILAPPAVRVSDGEHRSVAAELREAGVTVAFGSLAHGGTERLPVAAARAVRWGVSPGDALAALTTGAAELTGAPGGLGRLRPGDRADCVVFSGDPFEPTSRVLAVIVAGRLVHEWGGDSPPSSALGQ